MNMNMNMTERVSRRIEELELYRVQLQDQYKQSGILLIELKELLKQQIEDDTSKRLEEEANG